MALASYAVFSPERAPTPTALAAGFAVVLLPFSVLGPFAGVFLDRWQRRQVLVYANLLRVPVVLAIAIGTAAALPGVWLFGLALVSLSINRFLLAGLSAALPHVVREDDLVTANALTPTAGTAAFLAGLAVGSGLQVATGSEPAVLVAAAVAYLAAGLLATPIPRALLGPDFDPARPAVRRALRHVVSGLVDGLRHVHERRPAALALGTIASHRFFYGIGTVAVVLVYRNHLYPPSQAAEAFAALSVGFVVAGLGFVTAAFLTPWAADRWGIRAWVLALLLLASAVVVWPTLLFTQPALLVAGFLLGVVSQGVKIAADTIVQSSVDDAFRGRVFSLYDVLFNVAFVSAAAVAAVVLPDDGASVPVLAVMGVGYALTAAGYAWATRAAPTGPTGPSVPAR